MLEYTIAISVGPCRGPWTPSGPWSPMQPREAVVSDLFYEILYGTLVIFIFRFWQYFLCLNMLIMTFVYKVV